MIIYTPLYGWMNCNLLKNCPIVDHLSFMQLLIVVAIS